MAGIEALTDRPLMGDDAALRLAELLSAAHAQGESIGALPPGAAISSPAEAYRAQAAAAQSLGRIVGWKVGRKAPGASPARAPLFENRLLPSEARVPRDAFRVWRIESELMFRLGADPRPSRRSCTRADVIAAIDHVVVAFEIIDSRFEAWPDVAPELLLADNLSHGAMVVGSSVALPVEPSFERAPVTLV